MKKNIEKFIKGTQYVNIISPVTINELTKVKDINEDYLKKKCVKFVPASGAATRMFSDLYEFLNSSEQTKSVEEFFENLDRFAFYDVLKVFIDREGLDVGVLEDRIRITKFLLDGDMNYGNLPKALLKIHSYETFDATPIDEHIYEGDQYLDSVNIHFTISKEHEDLFCNYVKSIEKDKQGMNISYSFQKQSTDTLAVDMDDNPFLLEDGSVFYRAGGHGALIENLNDLDADIIFIKNIDNVCHRDHVLETIESKKMLASIGFEIKYAIDEYVKDLASGIYDIDEIESFIGDVLKVNWKKEMTADVATEILDRPFRVCGVVRNQGDPGGGPFVVENERYSDLQICEMSEIDMSDGKNREILLHSNYFNPVDLVCFVRNFIDEKYDLLDYVDESRYFISEKTHKGRKLKALEHPGLWNGAMHHWNTVFVEVPISTFTPVKKVNDLLRKRHSKKI